MLFSKDNYSKVESIIWDLNDSVYNTGDILDIRYLELDKEADKVYEIHRVYNSDEIIRKPVLVEKIDITNVFKGMLAFINE